MAWKRKQQVALVPIGKTTAEGSALHQFDVMVGRHFPSTAAQVALPDTPLDIEKKNRKMKRQEATLKGSSRMPEPIVRPQQPEMPMSTTKRQVKVRTERVLDFSFLDISSIDELAEVMPRSASQTLDGRYKASQVHLAGNSFTDITGLHAMLDSLLAGGAESVTSLNLSQNMVTSIPQELLLFTSLRSLNLQANNITSLFEVTSLSKLPLLRSLSTGGNPVEDIPGYKRHLLSHFPILRSLNTVAITPKERAMNASVLPPLRSSKGASLRSSGKKV